MVKTDEYVLVNRARYKRNIDQIWAMEWIFQLFQVWLWVGAYMCVREKGRANKMRKLSENVIAAAAVVTVAAATATTAVVAAATATVWREL